MVGWGQLNDAVKPLQILIFLKKASPLFPDLFPGFGLHTPDPRPLTKPNRVHGNADKTGKIVKAHYPL
jgi:hypothetical protein